MSQVDDEIKQINSSLKTVGDQLKAHSEEAQRQIKTHTDLSAETKASVDKLLITQGELNARLQSAEQIVARLENGGRGNEGEAPKSVGELVAENEGVREMNASYRGSRRVAMPRSALMNVPATVGDNTSGGNSLVGADRRPGILMPGQQRLTVRDLVAPGTTSSNSVEYARETGFTNNAAPVAEGGQKPYSDITFELDNAPVRTIAHLFKGSRQLLEDAPGLQSYIDARARWGLQIKEEAQLLYGNGTGANIHGIIPQASPFNEALLEVAMMTPIDRIRIALLQQVLAEFPANGIVLNPIDWARIETTKDAQGRYIIGNPANGTAATLWNLPVVETPSILVNEFLTGSFNLGAQIFDRMEIEVVISTENDKDFETNMISIRAEERLAFAVYRPESFVHGSVTVPAQGGG